MCSARSLHFLCALLAAICIEGICCHLRATCLPRASPVVHGRRSGTYFCMDKSVTSVVIKGLAEHKDELGAPLCPCRHYDDKVGISGGRVRAMIECLLAMPSAVAGRVVKTPGCAALAVQGQADIPPGEPPGARAASWAIPDRRPTRPCHPQAGMPAPCATNIPLLPTPPTQAAEAEMGFWNCPCVPMRERKVRGGLPRLVRRQRAAAQAGGQQWPAPRLPAPLRATPCTLPC